MEEEDKAYLEEYFRVKDEIAEAVHKIIENCTQLSLADVKKILYEVAEDINPYVGVEEIE